MARQAMTIPLKKPGETYQEYAVRLDVWRRGDDVRSKVDLREFKTATFHLNREDQ